MPTSSKIILKWNKSEQERFRELIRETTKISAALADKIINAVEENFTYVKQNPKIFEADQDKTNNDGSYRKFTVLHIKITYKIEPSQIIVLRVRHAASDPVSY